MHPGLARGYGDLLKPVAFRGDLIYADANRFTVPEPFEPLDPEEAGREVARRYLTRYGPATREDLAKWFGHPSPAQAGRWIEGAVETEYGWALEDGRGGDRGRGAVGRRAAAARLRPVRGRRAARRPRDARAGADLPARRLVLARAAGRRRDGGRVEPRGRRGHDRAVREGRQAGRARPPRPRPRGCRVRPSSSGSKLRGTAPLVTISASYGAGGSQVGPALAERLGVEFLDRAIPTRVADRLGCTLDDALAHDESLGDAIGRLASSFALLPELAGAMVQAGVLARRGLPARDREPDPRARGRRRRDPRPRGRRDPARPGRSAARPARRAAGAPRRAGDRARGPEPHRRRAPAPGRRPRARSLRPPLLRLRRARSLALSPRDRLDRRSPQSGSWT